jgi:hypothetical protein
MTAGTVHVTNPVTPGSGVTTLRDVRLCGGQANRRLGALLRRRRHRSRVRV